MVKKNVLVIALICILALIIGLMLVACTPKTEEGPDRDEAVALYNEVVGLRTEFLKQGKDLTQEPYGRAESIFALSDIYMERKMYSEALPGLGQAKTYYERFLTQ